MSQSDYWWQKGYAKGHAESAARCTELEQQLADAKDLIGTVHRVNVQVESELIAAKERIAAAPHMPSCAKLHPTYEDDGAGDSRMGHMVTVVHDCNCWKSAAMQDGGTKL